MEGRINHIEQSSNDDNQHYYVSDQESGQEGDYEDKSVFSDFKANLSETKLKQKSYNNITDRSGDWKQPKGNNDQSRHMKNQKKNMEAHPEPDYIKTDKNISEIDKVIMQMSNRKTQGKRSLRSANNDKNLTEAGATENNMEEEKNGASSNDSSINSNMHPHSLVVE